jgi:hypothetical protein
MTTSTSSQENDTKKLFRQCGTCSQTFAHLVNRENQHRDWLHEKALDPLAGGIFREGQQCGMLWGVALATGAEAYRQTNDVNEARAMAIAASKELVASFENQNHTLECREFTGVRLNTFMGLLKMMIDVMVIKGMENSKCFVMAEEWTPKSIKAAKEGLKLDTEDEIAKHNCSSQIVERLGGTEEEATMVAGFAGGIGLSGKGCGALAATIWMRAVKWLDDHPDKDVPMMSFPEVSQIIKRFKAETGNKLRCEEICNRRFESSSDHSEYIEQGGCEHLLDLLENAFEATTVDH